MTHHDSSFPIDFDQIFGSFSFPSQALMVPCNCQEGCPKPMFHNEKAMLNELRKSYPPKMSSYSGGLNEEKESEDKIDETYQSANELLIETKVGFHLFFRKNEFCYFYKSHSHF